MLLKGKILLYVCMALLIACKDSDVSMKGEITVVPLNASYGTVYLYKDSVQIARDDFDQDYSMEVHFSAGQLGLTPGTYQVKGVSDRRSSQVTIDYKGGFQNVDLEFK